MNDQSNFKDHPVYSSKSTFRLCEVLSQVKINEDTNPALLNDVEVAVNKWVRA